MQYMYMYTCTILHCDSYSVGVYTLRCMIDFIRLSDMSDSVCDMDPINWAELPIPVFDNHDIKGVLMDKALWVQSLVRLYTV